MTLGKYPGGVPKEHLLAPSLFASDEDIGRFTDAAPRVGLDTIFSEAGGLIVDDFDDDGLFDFVTSDWDFCAPMHFFHNNGLARLPTAARNRLTSATRGSTSQSPQYSAQCLQACRLFAAS